MEKRLAPLTRPFAMLLLLSVVFNIARSQILLQVRTRTCSYVRTYKVNLIVYFGNDINIFVHVWKI